MNKKLIWITSIVLIAAAIVAGVLLLNKPREFAVTTDIVSVSIPEDIKGRNLTGTVYIAPILVHGSNVKKVELFVDGVMAHVSYSSPFKLSLDTSQLKNGTHKIYLRAIDNDNKAVTSSTLTIIVKNETETDTVSTGDTSTAVISPSTEQGSVGVVSPKKTTTTTPTANSGSNTGNTDTTPVDPGTPGTDEPDQPTGDTQRPATVTGVGVIAPTNTSTHVTWNATTDNTAVTEYNVYRSGILVATVDQDTLAYDDTAVVPGNYYTYAVTAEDEADNVSPTSLRVAVTMPYASVITADPVLAQDSNETSAINVGMKFTVKADGVLTGVRFYKLPGNTGYHTATIWKPDMTLLRTAEFVDETASGWQTGTFTSPLQVVAGETFTVSYHTATGHYAYTPGAFSGAQPSSPYIEAVQSSDASKNGVYKYSEFLQYPEDGANGTSYWVDPTFVPYDTVNNATTDNLATIPWEGGPSYYEQFAKTSGSWTDSNFFPVGVWFEAVTEQSQVDADKAFGINTYVELTSNSDLSLVERNGQNAIITYRAGAGNETKGYVSLDEADMYFGPGNAAWNRTTFKCVVDNSWCGYTAMAESKALHPAGDGRFDYANFGKGVMMWEGPAQASGFVNNYTTVTSADLYFYTDPNLCPGEAGRYLGISPNLCQRSANYGMVIDKMRGLDAMDNVRQPIWAFIEDGHPFSDQTATTITPNQLAGAVYSSLIHEARGIIYFNHNFGGTCNGNQHSMRDNCYPETNAKIIAVNQQIKDLAPVLNTQSLAYTASPALDTMLKKYNDSYYLYAMTSLKTPTGSQTIRLPADLASASSVEVLYENRSLPITNGTFVDTFANEYSYHIYKITP